MKRIMTLLVAALYLCCSLSGCAQKAATRTVNDNKKVTVVTTIFPIYDWVREIVGENTDSVNVRLLIDKGVDLHSYQPSVEDILEISTCDIFIYAGGESDEWVEDALKEATNKDMVVISLVEALGDKALEEEVVEGMEHEHDHDHEDHDEEEHEHEGDEEHEDDEEHEHEDEHETDEHVWLSIKNAVYYMDMIEEKLSNLVPDKKESFRENKTQYEEKLIALDKEYEETVANASAKTLLFGDRFPFRYLTEDYGLDYFAAFAGCSAETEASFETIIFLAGKVDELGLKTILTIDGSDGKIANTIKENTTDKDMEISSLHSMQSLNGIDDKDSVTYESIMRDNLEVIKKALK